MSYCVDPSLDHRALEREINPVSWPRVRPASREQSRNVGCIRYPHPAVDITSGSRKADVYITKQLYEKLTTTPPRARRRDPSALFTGAAESAATSSSLLTNQLSRLNSRSLPLSLFLSVCFRRPRSAGTRSLFSRAIKISFTARSCSRG